MTSRLRRKLDDLESNGQNLNESFVLIGTPLPALADNKKDKNEFVPLWQQEVRDDQGRRRFHGAFTGGFSAGYYNSVGSKEGWTPSSFRSSRSDRAVAGAAGGEGSAAAASAMGGSGGVGGGKNRFQQTAEDFMDEEDLQDLRDTRRLENTETFRIEKEDAWKGTADELGSKDKGGVNGLSSAFASFIQPASSSIGEKILTRMGWKPGQGVGPRVSARQLQRQRRRIASRLGSTSTRALVEEEEDVLMDAEGAAKGHKFAPRDNELLIFDQKNDRQGLGFEREQGMRMATMTASTSGLGDSDVSAGFGLGLHEADEDDRDVYDGGQGALSSSLNGQSRIVVEDEDEPQWNQRQGAARHAKPKYQRNPLQSSNQANVWNDGRPVLTGFEIDPSGVVPDKWFDFPSMPPDWRPRPARVWKSVTGGRWDKTGNEPKVVPDPVGVRQRPQLSADQRGHILGEEQLVVAKNVEGISDASRSVTDYMSEKSKERLALAAASGENDHIATGVSLTGSSEPSLANNDLMVPPLSPRTATAALNGFIPFADDPPKQERYKSYLVSQTYNSKQPHPALLPGASIHDINKELSDFSKSATMFKPMSFAMANRFTSSKANAADISQPKPGLHVPDPEKVKEWKNPTEIQQEVEEHLTPRQTAARSGLFGNLTRRVEPWAPNRLLCKRLGVADPYPAGLRKDDGGLSTSASTNTATGTKPLLTDISWESKFVHKEDQVADPDKTPEATTTRSQPKTLADVGMAEDDNQGRDTLTYKKPEMDIFKAIFASDDETDDEEEQEEEATTQLSVVPQKATPNNQPQLLTRPDLKINATDEEDIEGPIRPVFQIKPIVTKDDLKPKRTSDKEKKKRTKQSKILMSFDVNEDEEEEVEKGDRLKKRKRKDKESSLDKKQRKEPGEEDDDWVEKEVVIPAVTNILSRARASDFL